MIRINVEAEMVQAIKDNQLLNWWKNNSPDRPEKYPWTDVCVLPEKTQNEMSGQIEVIGPSGAGKSEFLQYYRQHSDSNVEILPELILRNSDGTLENWSHGENSQKMQGLMASEFGVRHQIMIWNQIKLASHLQGEVRQLQNDKLLNLVMERTVNDVLCTDSFTRPEHYSIRYDSIFEENWLNNIFLSVTLAQKVDAVVLFGTTWQETKKRRTKQGLKSEGKYVNRQNWPEIMSGYEWWLGSFYPMFRRTNGMGLLIVDGTQPLERNNAKITQFCNQIFSVRSSR